VVVAVTAAVAAVAVAAVAAAAAVAVAVADTAATGTESLRGICHGDRVRRGSLKTTPGQRFRGGSGCFLTSRLRTLPCEPELFQVGN
jgi:hypothetical protein